MMNRGFRIIYIDETMITKSTMPTHNLSAKYDRVDIDYHQYSSDVIATIAGIS